MTEALFLHITSLVIRAIMIAKSNIESNKRFAKLEARFVKLEAKVASLKSS